MNIIVTNLEQITFLELPLSLFIRKLWKLMRQEGKKWRGTHLQLHCKGKNLLSFTWEIKINNKTWFLKYLKLWDSHPSEQTKFLGKCWCHSIREWWTKLSMRGTLELRRMLSRATQWLSYLQGWKNMRRRRNFQKWRERSSQGLNLLTCSAPSNHPEQSLYPTLRDSNFNFNTTWRARNRATSLPFLNLLPSMNQSLKQGSEVI